MKVTPGMLRTLEKQVRELLERQEAADQPLTVNCFHESMDPENRPPGMYWTGPDGHHPEIVYDGKEPPAELLDQFRNARGDGPLIINLPGEKA